MNVKAPNISKNGIAHEPGRLGKLLRRETYKPLTDFIQKCGKFAYAMRMGMTKRTQDDVQAFAGMLSEGVPEKNRVRAANELFLIAVCESTLDIGPAVPALGKALGDGSAKVRKNAASALYRASTDKADMAPVLSELFACVVSRSEREVRNDSYLAILSAMPRLGADSLDSLVEMADRASKSNDFVSESRSNSAWFEYTCAKLDGILSLVGKQKERRGEAA
jgi:hypothetical protein